ncbi:uncharacterized protein LOC106994782 [Macaca mulatta]
MPEAGRPARLGRRGAARQGVFFVSFLLTPAPPAGNRPAPVPEAPGELPAALPGWRCWAGGAGRAGEGVGSRGKKLGGGDSGCRPGVGRSAAEAPPLIEPIGARRPGARRRGRVQGTEIVEEVDSAERASPKRARTHTQFRCSFPRLCSALGEERPPVLQVPVAIRWTCFGSHHALFSFTRCFQFLSLVQGFTVCIRLLHGLLGIPTFQVC